jgi:hypothetical protein
MEGSIVVYIVCVLLLILRDQPVVGSLGLICLVAASGHNYLALWVYTGCLVSLAVTGVA